jgi:hypothetical protein
MTDIEIITNAVAAIAATPTGQGRIRLGGVPAYNERYADYATRTLALLRGYIDEGDEIAFAALPDNKYADSDRRWGANIRVDRRFRGMTAVVAVLLVHEGCHLLREVRLSNGVEQEVICRTLGVCVYRDLIAGVSITGAGSERRGSSPPRMTMIDASRPVTLRISLPACDAPIELSVQDRAVQANRLIDWVVQHGYANLLRARWINDSIAWWGGLSHREPATKGHYLRCLAHAGASYGALILRILESISGPTYRQDWDALVAASALHEGLNEEDLRRALAPLRHVPDLCARIRIVEQRLPLDLGCGGRRPVMQGVRAIP